MPQGGRQQDEGKLAVAGLEAPREFPPGLGIEPPSLGVFFQVPPQSGTISSHPSLGVLLRTAAMATIRRRTLKVLTLLVLFIFLTSLLLNYSHITVTTTWFPKQIVIELSENFKKLMTYSHRPCTCARCLGQRGVSPWFDERFNWSMQPLLTAQNALLEDGTYSWWLVRAGAERGPGVSGGAQRLGTHLGPCRTLCKSHNIRHSFTPSFIQTLLTEDLLYISQSRRCYEDSLA